MRHRLVLVHVIQISRDCLSHCTLSTSPVRHLLQAFPSNDVSNLAAYSVPSHYSLENPTVFVALVANGALLLVGHTGHPRHDTGVARVVLQLVDALRALDVGSLEVDGLGGGRAVLEAALQGLLEHDLSVIAEGGGKEEGGSEDDVDETHFCCEV